MPRMRLLKEAYAEIKETDPNTALTMYTLRRMVLSGIIPHLRVGSRILINMDTLNDCLNSVQNNNVLQVNFTTGVYKIT